MSVLRPYEAGMYTIDKLIPLVFIKVFYKSRRYYCIFKDNVYNKLQENSMDDERNPIPCLI